MRKEDILAIATSLIELFNEKHGKNIREIGPTRKRS